MSDRPDIGEQAISKTAEVAIDSQLDAVEELEVDIRTNPLDLAQGKLESVTVDSQGMVMNRDLRAERLILQTDSIAIDSLKAALGNIELEQSTNAEARVVLLESDIQRAFNSKYIKNKLKNRQVNINGETRTVNVCDIQFSLPGNDKVDIKATIDIAESSRSKQIAVSAKPRVATQGNTIMLEDVEYPNENNDNAELTEALLESTQEILDLRNFELDEMSLQVQRLDISQGKMIIAASALIEEFLDR